MADDFVQMGSSLSLLVVTGWISFSLVVEAGTLGKRTMKHGVDIGEHPHGCGN